MCVIRNKQNPLSLCIKRCWTIQRLRVYSLQYAAQDWRPHEWPWPAERMRLCGPRAFAPGQSNSSLTFDWLCRLFLQSRMAYLRVPHGTMVWIQGAFLVLQALLPAMCFWQRRRRRMKPPPFAEPNQIRILSYPIVTNARHLAAVGRIVERHRLSQTMNHLNNQVFHDSHAMFQVSPCIRVP
jgi:hypothetical protein